MRKIKLLKIDLNDLEVLHDELNLFIVNKSQSMLAVRHTDKYYQYMLLMDIAQKVYIDFRGKIENAARSITTISCKVHEAIVLMQVIIEAGTKSDLRERHAMEKFKTSLHQQLVNI